MNTSSSVIQMKYSLICFIILFKIKLNNFPTSDEEAKVQLLKKAASWNTLKVTFLK